MKKNFFHTIFNIPVVIFLFFLIVCTSCDENIIPFKNPPHLEYFDLKGNVAEVQTESYIYYVQEEGYSKMNLLDFVTFPPFNNIFLHKDVLTKDQLDVFYRPIEELSEIRKGPFPFLAKVTAISKTFTREGYLSSASYNFKDTLLYSAKYEYDDENRIKIINKKFKTPIYSLSLYGNSVKYNDYYHYSKTTFSYNGNNILENQCSKFTSKKDTIKIISNYSFRQEDDYILEIKTSQMKDSSNVFFKDSSFIYLDDKEDIYKITSYKNYLNKENSNSEANLYLDDNIVYKKMPGRHSLIYNKRGKIVEDNTYKYEYYDLSSKDDNQDYHDGLLKRIYIKDIGIYAFFNYKKDSRGNWIELEIIPNRTIFDKKINRFYELLEENKELDHSFDELNNYYESNKNMYYFTNKEREKIISEMLKITDSKKTNVEELNELETYIQENSGKFAKIIVKRNIIYYN